MQALVSVAHKIALKTVTEGLFVADWCFIGVVFGVEVSRSKCNTCQHFYGDSCCS